MSTNRVAVGIDGSRFAAFALDWAIERAIALAAEVQVVNAWSPTTPVFAEGIPVPAPPNAEAAAARTLLRRAVETVKRREQARLPTITTSAKRGEPARILASLRADQVVVGTQGLGFVDRVLLGSTADRLVARAVAPVTVVPFRRSLPMGDGRIVVGVDGSPSADAALRYAMRVAAACRAPLAIVCAFPAGGALTSEASHSARRALARVAIEASVERAAAAGAPAPKRVTHHAVPGVAASVLLDIAKPASELVVGFGRHGRPSGYLGSVSRRCVHRAPCAVTVVKPPPAR